MPRRWLAPDFFTDEKMKKATVPERLLASALIANQDDDGRLRGDPAYLRAIAFLYDDYSLEEVKAMRDHLTQVNPNILVYQNSGEEYIQLKRYKRYQKPRYYHPSKYPVPPGWPFQEESNQVVTTQQPSSNQMDTLGKGKNLDLDQNKGKGKGKGKGPERHPSPSPAGSENRILDDLTAAYRKRWGTVRASDPETIIPREPNARILAQLRDLGKELGQHDCPAAYIYQAFDEAAKAQKFKIPYVRAILLDWLGIERNRSP